jgi:hypothetical protein
MKKFAIVWSVVVALAILLGVAACANAETYPQTFVVDSVNHEQNYMVLVDFNGNEWIWEGVEDFDRGDIVAAIMEERGTPTIYDDEIVKIRYTGYMEGWE